MQRDDTGLDDGCGDEAAVKSPLANDRTRPIADIDRPLKMLRSQPTKRTLVDSATLQGFQSDGS